VTYVRILNAFYRKCIGTVNGNSPPKFQCSAGFPSKITNKYAHSTFLIIICSNARLLTVCMLMQTRGNYCLFDLIVCPSYANIPVVWSMSDRHCEIELQQSSVVTTLWHATGSTATAVRNVLQERVLVIHHSLK
jgi:hypothetical protein